MEEKKCVFCENSYPIPCMLNGEDPECPYVRCSISNKVMSKDGNCIKWKEKDPVYEEVCGNCRWWGERPSILCGNRKSVEFLEEKRWSETCDEWEDRDDWRCRNNS